DVWRTGLRHGKFHSGAHDRGAALDRRPTSHSAPTIAPDRSAHVSCRSDSAIDRRYGAPAQLCAADDRGAVSRSSAWLGVGTPASHSGDGTCLRLAGTPYGLTERP